MRSTTGGERAAKVGVIVHQPPKQAVDLGGVQIAPSCKEQPAVDVSPSGGSD